MHEYNVPSVVRGVPDIINPLTCTDFRGSNKFVRLFLVFFFIRIIVFLKQNLTLDITQLPWFFILLKYYEYKIQFFQF